MFRHLCILLVLLIAAGCSSDPINNLLSFNVSREQQIVVPPGSASLDTSYVFTILDSAAELREHQTSREGIAEVLLNRISLNSSVPLNGIDTVQLIFQADTLAPVVAATLHSLPNDTRHTVAPLDTNVAGFFRQPGFELRVRLVYLQPPIPMSLSIDETFYVIAEPR